MSPIPPLLRRLCGAALAAALICAAPAARGADEPVCACAQRRACYHFLRAPVAPPEEGCACPKCTPQSRHAGQKLPAGWNPVCFDVGGMDCFLKRHAASWNLDCSECLADEDCCRTPHPERCPECQDGERPGPWRKNAREESEKRVAVEREVFDRAKPVVVTSRHFHVVTDIPRVRVRTDAGLRNVETHEYAHLVAERAERVYLEFAEAFGGPPALARPMGIYLPQRERTAAQIKSKYFRNAGTHMIYAAYGSAVESAISGGFCLNGFCVSEEKFGNKELDREIHQAVRHLATHVMITCWVRVVGTDRSMPRWAFVGAAHWLGKRLPSTQDWVYYCTGEDQKLSGSGKDWLADLGKRAARGGLRPIGELLEANSLGQLDYPDHQQSWAYFHFAMQDLRQPFVELLRDLRRERDVREAMAERLGMAPEVFHRRVEERLLGRRETIADLPTDAAGSAAQAPSAGSLGDASLDPRERAARLRSAGVPRDAATVGALLDAIAGQEGDLVRETAYHVLLGTDGEDARRAIWTRGLGHPDRLVRAYAARLCRRLGLAEARDELRKALDDGFWLVRAEAALAAAAIRDFDSQERLREMTGKDAPKVRIGAMDALASLGEEANPRCVAPIAANLSHADWQVRVAAAQALAHVGDRTAVEPLIARMELEGGRVREACREALCAITFDDLGAKPENWRTWWEREAPHAAERGGFDRPKAPSAADERYAEAPEYYGIQVYSASVCFVLDTSRSTLRNFQPDRTTTERLGLAGRDDLTVYGICQEQIVKTLRDLPAWARFNVIAFGTDVFRWDDAPQRASRAAVDSAEGFVRRQSPAGETNFHGALSAALDLERTASWGPGFRDTADTLTFLTDGSPTVGDVTDPDVLLEWYTELNRYARVRTHTFAFGTLGVDSKLLRGLAARNWGEFHQVRERH